MVKYIYIHYLNKYIYLHVAPTTKIVKTVSFDQSVKATSLFRNVIKSRTQNTSAT